MKLLSTVEQILNVYGDLFIGKALIINAMKEVDKAEAIKIYSNQSYN